MNKDEVEDILNFKGLLLGEVTEQFSSYPEGYVCATLPDIKESPQVAKGSSVDIVVSKGKIPAAEFNISLPKHQSAEHVEVSLWHEGSKFIGTEGQVSFNGENSVTYKFTGIEISAIPQTYSVYYYTAAIGNVEIMKLKFTDITQSSGKYVLVYETVS